MDLPKGYTVFGAIFNSQEKQTGFTADDLWALCVSLWFAPGHASACRQLCEQTEDPDAYLFLQTWCCYFEK